MIADRKMNRTDLVRDHSREAFFNCVLYGGIGFLYHYRIIFFLFYGMGMFLIVTGKYCQAYDYENNFHPFCRFCNMSFVIAARS